MFSHYLYCVAFLIIFGACSSNENNTKEDSKPKIEVREIITRYYSLVTKDGIPQRDSLMECFSCNQGIEFDRDGRELALRFYKADLDSLYGFETYNYNEQGFKIGADYYENDSIVTKYTYKTDSHGRILVARAFDRKSGSMLYGYQNKYNVSGQAYETGNLNGDGEVYEYYQRTFNENGLPVTEDIADLEGNITFKIKYEYRPQANEHWKEQIAYYNGQLSEIRFREFVYFDF